jgi:hypothetical protein
VDVGYIPILEQPLELGFDKPIGNILLRKESPTGRIGVESKTLGKEVDGETPIRRIRIAIVLVDENRAGQGKAFPSVERIVCEQDPAFSADRKSFQTLAARPVTGGHFGMCRMTIAR